MSYIFGDILTGVYGYRSARRVIWMDSLPRHDSRHAGNGQGINTRAAGRINNLRTSWALRPVSYGSWCLLGELILNAVVLARLKVFHGRWLWVHDAPLGKVSTRLSLWLSPSWNYSGRAFGLRIVSTMSSSAPKR